MQSIRTILGLALLLGSAACSGGMAASVAAANARKAAARPDPTAEAAAKSHRVVKEHAHVTIGPNVLALNAGTVINFKTGSDDLEGDSYPVLDEVGSAMDENVNLLIRVEGHTDNVGRSDDNYDLSARRADAVAKYLIAWGVPRERIDAVGCGPDVPIADNRTPEGQARNRRVEFVIVSSLSDNSACRRR